MRQGAAEFVPSTEAASRKYIALAQQFTISVLVGQVEWLAPRASPTCSAVASRDAECQAELLQREALAPRGSFTVWRPSLGPASSSATPLLLEENAWERRSSRSRRCGQFAAAPAPHLNSPSLTASRRWSELGSDSDGPPQGPEGAKEPKPPRGPEGGMLPRPPRRPEGGMEPMPPREPAGGKTGKEPKAPRRPKGGSPSSRISCRRLAPSRRPPPRRTPRLTPRSPPRSRPSCLALLPWPRLPPR